MDDSSDSLECRVCGAVATGLHYGVKTCEGCKVFFKRFMGKHQNYRCYFGGDCEITRRTRSRCKACRYKKCTNEGMSVEAIRLGRTPGKYKTIEWPTEEEGSLEEDSAATSRDESFLSLIEPARNKRHKTDASESDVDSGLFSTACPSEEPSQSIGSGSGQLMRRFSSGGGSPAVTRSLVSFSDENLNFMLSDFVSEFVRPCLLPEIPMPKSPTLQPALEPTMLQKYWGIMRARDEVLANSAKAVTNAMNAVFSEQIRTYYEFVNLWYGQGLVPFQPQCTLKQMIKWTEDLMAEFADKMFQFALLIPGFSNIDLADRVAILQDRWLICWAITFSFCYRDNMEAYFPVGPYNMHHGRYWIRQFLNEKLAEFIFSIATELNALQLNFTETFLLLTVSIFRLDAEDKVRDKAFIDFLYSHYLDALINLIGHGKGDLLTKIQQVVRRFSVVNSVHRRYVLTGNFTAGPLGNDAQEDLAAVINLNPDQFVRTDFNPTNYG